MTYHEVVREMKSLSSERPEDYYVGTTSDPSEQKMWHCVEKDWHHYKMPSEEAASRAKEELVDHGCEGGRDGIGDGAFVYIFRITRTTRQR